MTYLTHITSRLQPAAVTHSHTLLIVISKQTKSFKVYSVDQRPNLRHSCEPLGGTQGLIKTVGFKKMTESMCGRTSVNVSRE